MTYKDGLFKHYESSSLDIAIRKKITKYNLNIYLRGTDLLKTSYQSDNAIYGINYNTKYYGDNFSIKLGLRWYFGKLTVKIEEKVKTNNDEEKNRLSNTKN